MREDKVRPVVSVPFTPALFEEVSKAAERAGKKLSQFIREAAIAQAMGVTVHLLDRNITFLNRATTDDRLSLR